jgi:hypothetical protein
MVKKEGNCPSHSSAPNAGVHMSNNPCGVLERAKNNFKRERPVKLFCGDVSDI